MTELLTAAQMRKLEKDAIDSSEVSGLTLMERAGQGVLESVFAKWPEFSGRTGRAIVLCGPGNNGGDGFVIGRLLAEKGWEIDLFLFGDAAKLPANARSNHDRWAEAHPVLAWDIVSYRQCARPDLFVDAVFGIGLTRPLPEKVAAMLDPTAAKHWKRAGEIRRVAVDCPSGLDLDTGMIPLAADAEDSGYDPWPARMNAVDLTVTFHSPKPGHYLGMGPMLCKDLRVVDIGLRGSVLERSLLLSPPDPERARLVVPEHAGRVLGWWPASLIGKMRHGGHKYDHGHILVFAGHAGRGGAARLAARAALRAGAGLVTVLCPPAALQENAARLDAVMLRALPEDAPLASVVDDRITGFVLGPGMGVNARTRQLVLEALALRAGARDHRDPAVVLDADALTSFADDPEALFNAVHARTLLTPHQGEFARLFPDLDAAFRAGSSKIAVVRQAAARAGCLVLLKGHDTVIAEPGGGVSLHAASYDR
ncbi:MAG: NAD(P)H-hydrate epimerase, partial [Roseobacter sp.]|nr:NAD(P)H-hydrate epimerase [Roseobacter sp.]